MKVVDYINQDVSGGSLLVELASPFWEVILDQPTRFRLVATFHMRGRCKLTPMHLPPRDTLPNIQSLALLRPGRE